MKLYEHALARVCRKKQLRDTAMLLMLLEERHEGERSSPKWSYNKRCAQWRKKFIALKR